ncbi:MAG: MlaD family protein [Bryobacteraceae bacterium]|nr:MlaD family protein [Bryobacteraceae bacterium]
MPSSRTATWAQLRVGILAAGAIVILAVLVFLMTGNKNLFASEGVVYTYVDDSAAMTEGAAVRLNGILVGEITKITLTGSKAENQRVRFDLAIREEMMRYIPVDSLVTVGAENVLGTKFINIKQGTAQETIRAGSTIKAREDRDFLEIVQSAQPILESMRMTLQRVDAIVGQVEKGQGSIGKLLYDEELYRRLNGILADVQKTTTAINTGRGTLGRLLYDETLYNDVRGMLARLDTIMVGIQNGEGTAGRLIKDPTLYNEITKTTTELRRLAEDLNAGKGTAGKLLKSEELHNQIRATLARVDGMIEKVNSGQGTLGQLLVNPSLYDSVNGATRELNGLLQDFRANPKKFLRIKLSLF